jgi:hypothetical protein
MHRTAFALLVIFAACRQAQGPEPSRPFQDRLLATIPDGAELLVPPAFAPSGDSVAFVPHTKEKDWVLHDAWESRPFTLV